VSRVGVVIIGRNEGERLRRCLRSAAGERVPTIYVDSGSTDGSVAAAREAGADVVELDLSSPFTAGRARNAGFERLRERAPDIAFVQFVDGDCELTPGWLDRGAVEMEKRPDAAIVAGRVRERFREASIYNRLCDIEWDAPAGESESCGGILMARAVAFRDVGGFNPAMIAGEEPELCVRLRERGGRIFRIDADMATHDAAMTRFGQWWKRMVRGGHAYAEGFAMHGGPPMLLGAREGRSIWFWGLLLPLLALGPAWWTRGWSLLLLLGYAALAWRIGRGLKRKLRLAARDARLYAAFTVLGKFPQLLGQVKYWRGRLMGKRSRLIEHKGGPR